MFKVTSLIIKLAFIALVLLVTSCTEETKTEKGEKAENATEQVLPKTTYKAKIDIIKPKAGKVIRRGEPIVIELKITEDTREIDSLEYFVNGTKVLASDKTISTDDFKSGKNIITVKSYQNDGSKDQVSTHIMALSDKTPEAYKVKVIKTYPHDVTAYTQGLIFTDGYLYEGTGQPRESMLKKIDLKKNELIQSYNLPAEVFGEGIVLQGDKIYQITWQSRRAFVYDLKTFSLINEFQYDTEGWGITNYYDELIMSDGTQNLYIVNSASFSVTDQLQVTDHVGPINNLNELEWINGKIWANVYLTNTIVIIDPKTGFVESKIDLTSIVPDTHANPHDNVLNGIAYDKKADKIYVTGKRWPTLFEIELVK